MAGQIIALTGERGVGKDHLTLHAINNMEHVTRLSFSDEVRRIAYSMFPFLKENEGNKNDPILGEVNNPNNLSWREIIKSVGKVCRDVDPAYFVNQFIINQWPMTQIGSGLYMITDLRTQDEYAFLQTQNVPIVKITAPTGLEPDDFEEWTRRFEGYTFLFENELNKESEQEFLKLTKRILYRETISGGDFLHMLTLQNSTNKAYAGEDWKNVASAAKYHMAAEREFIEFADEINRAWHWWAKQKFFEVNKALIEFCDYVCFSLCLYYYSNVDQLFNQPIESYIYEPKGIYDNFDEYYRLLLNSRKWRETILSQSLETKVTLEYCLLDEINLTIEYLGITASNFREAFESVSARNVNRGNKGAGSGVDVKSSETPICIIDKEV